MVTNLATSGIFYFVDIIDKFIIKFEIIRMQNRNLKEYC